jgi:tetratricopeptide (TPR) repeat protein
MATRANVHNLFTQALGLHETGRLSEAEALYRQILSREARHAGALHFLGVMADQTGHREAALQLIGESIVLRPNWAEAHCNLGNVLRALGRVEEAIKAYQRAIALQPGFAEAYANLGNALSDTGNEQEAISAYRQAVKLKPQYGQGHYNLGNALMKAGRMNEAINAYQRSIQLCPMLAEAHYNLGTALRAEGALEESASACRRAVAIKPDYADAWNNLGLALHAIGKTEEAIAAFRKAVQIRIGFAEAHVNLGNALKDAGTLDQALEAYQAALQAEPTLYDVYSNIGNLYRERGRIPEAIDVFRKALTISPDSGDLHHNYACTLLLSGDYHQGWKEYEWRWKMPGFPSRVRDFWQPKWDGSDLAGRTLLLHTEQGLGDAVQFIRYVDMLSAADGQIVIECQPELKRLFSNRWPKCMIIARGENIPQFDIHCPLLSLPAVLGTTLETIPACVPYLIADHESILSWKPCIARYTASLSVGLVWSGNKAHKNDRNRSLSLSHFGPLAGIKGVTFASLQKGDSANQVINPPNGMDLIDYAPQLHDLADTAALISSLDLVITADTAVAHLAGALAKRVWVLLPYAPDWRWMLNRPDSPWYPTMRLFRQTRAGDWSGVIDNVRDELNRLRDDFVPATKP